MLRPLKLKQATTLGMVIKCSPSQCAYSTSFIFAELKVSQRLFVGMQDKNFKPIYQGQGQVKTLVQYIKYLSEFPWTQFKLYGRVKVLKIKPGIEAKQVYVYLK